MNQFQDQYDFHILGKRYSLPRIDADSKTKESILLNATLLFARRGYASVSMRDIADTIGIKPASLYNHFNSKEVMWREAVNHAKELYLFYFNHLEQAMEGAGTFEEVLELVFQEPKKLKNIFTCYAFCMIQAEQFRDPDAGEAFNDIFLKYSVDIIRKWFDKTVELGLVRPFDTGIVAFIVMNSVLIGLDLKVHECMGREIPFEPGGMLARVQRFILDSVNRAP